jgi:hypothetical protein
MPSIGIYDNAIGLSELKVLFVHYPIICLSILGSGSVVSLLVFQVIF